MTDTSAHAYHTHFMQTQTEIHTHSLSFSLSSLTPMRALHRCLHLSPSLSQKKDFFFLKTPLSVDSDFPSFSFVFHFSTKLQLFAVYALLGDIIFQVEEFQMKVPSSSSCSSLHSTAPLLSFLSLLPALAPPPPPSPPHSSLPSSTFVCQSPSASSFPLLTHTHSFALPLSPPPALFAWTSSTHIRCINTILHHNSLNFFNTSV